MAQPYLLVELFEGRRFVLNENNICSVSPDSNGRAVVRMANGDEFTLEKPKFTEWEWDCYVRKE